MQTIDYSGRKSLNVTTNGTVTIAGRWILNSVIINTKGASSNTVTIYKGGVVDSNNILGKIDSTITIGELAYNHPMLDGIYMVVATGTAPDITIIYEPAAGQSQ